MWVVTTTSDHDGRHVEAAFADHLDAHHYATWWNREETRRSGHRTPHNSATADAEEADYYPAGTWRPPVQLRAVTAASRQDEPTVLPHGATQRVGSNHFGGADDPRVGLAWADTSQARVRHHKPTPLTRTVEQ